MPDKSSNNVSIQDWGIRTIDVRCSDEPASATVSTSRGKVKVRGRIKAENTCRVATIKDISYNDSEKTLYVNITTSKTDEMVCTQCIAAVQYDANIEVGDNLPENVKISHNGSQITSHII